MHFLGSGGICRFPWIFSVSAKPVASRDRVARRPGAKRALIRKWKERIRWPVSRVLFPGEPGRRPFICDRPCGRSGATYPDDMRRRMWANPFIPIRSCSRWGLPCPLPCGRGGALLPHPFTLTGAEAPAVCSLLRFPWGHPRRELPGTLSPWSPDFPRWRRFQPCHRGRPAT